LREKENSESRRERDEEEGGIPGCNGESLPSAHQASTLQLLAGELAGIGVSGPITGAIQSPLQRAEVPLLGAEQSMILLARIFAGDEAAALCYVSGTMNGV